jgi:hypothetical protein
MKVSVSFAASEKLRRAINHRYGNDGLADDVEVAQWFTDFGTSQNEDAIYELGQFEEAEIDEPVSASCGHSAAECCC